MRWTDKYPSIAIVFLSFLGLFDALYLSAEKYLGRAPACFITTNCDTVTNGLYSVFLGVPVAYLGLFYYLALFLLSVAYISSERKVPTDTLIRFISGFGFLFSLYLVFLQVFVIKALCIYCITSATISTLIFILSWSLRPASADVSAPSSN